MLFILVLYFRLLNRIRKVRYVLTYATAFDKDGGGAQLHNRIATWAFSNATGGEFHNSPMVKVWHAEGDPELWIRRWNDLFDFPRVNKNEVPEEIYELKVTQILLYPWRGSSGATINVNVVNPHYFTDVFPLSVHSIRPKIRRIFQLPDVIPSHWSRDVGLHLRVSQPTDTTPITGRVSDLGVILKTLELKNSSRTVVVFSSPSSADPPIILTSDFEVSNDDALVSIGKMTLVKELVLGKSSMSYIAGLVSTKKVWYQEFWHPAMPDWEIL